MLVSWSALQLKERQSVPADYYQGSQKVDFDREILLHKEIEMSDDNSESELYDNFRLTIQEKSNNENVSGMILNL